MPSPGSRWFRRRARRRARRSCQPGSQLALGQAAATSSSAGRCAPDRSGGHGAGRSGAVRGATLCVRGSDSRGWARVLEGIPLRARQKETLGPGECRLAGRSAGFSCLVFTNNSSRKRDVEAATQTGQTRAS